jgi:hypothetical protein
VSERVVGQPDRSCESLFVLQPAAPRNPAFNEPASAGSLNGAFEVIRHYRRISFKPRKTVWFPTGVVVAGASGPHFGPNLRQKLSYRMPLMYCLYSAIQLTVTTKEHRTVKVANHLRLFSGTHSSFYRLGTGCPMYRRQGTTEIPSSLSILEAQKSFRKIREDQTRKSDPAFCL